MSSPGWDTTSDPTTRRTGGRDRIALVIGISLLVIAVLAALTGKVLAMDAPTLAENSPTADHVQQNAPQPTPESQLPDPESLFLDLPDPPPPAPETPPANTSPNTNTAAPSNTTRKAKTTADRRQGKAQAAGSTRNGGGASDIPVSKADFQQLPEKPTVEPGSGNAEELLDNPNCRFSVYALMDLEAGVVDEYLISALQAVCQEHTIYVNVFKTGHTFGAGLPEGPEIPVGYGNAGGYPNTHYFGRGADIWEVDGKPVEGNGSDPAVVSVGRILAGLPQENRPDVVIGPNAWNQVLGYGPEQGWVIDADQVALHSDHLHVGYWKGDGTPPPQIFMSPRQATYYTSPAPVRRARDYSESRARSTSTNPKPRETIEPAESPAPKPRPNAETKEPGPRKETTRQKSVVRKVQRTEDRVTGTRNTDSTSTTKEPEKGKAPEEKPEDPQPNRGGGLTEERPTPGTTDPPSQYSTEPEITAPGATRAEETLTGGGTTLSGTGDR